MFVHKADCCSSFRNPGFRLCFLVLLAYVYCVCIGGLISSRIYCLYGRISIWTDVVESFHLLVTSASCTDNNFHGIDFWKNFDFALLVLGIDVSAQVSQGSFSPWFCICDLWLCICDGSWDTATVSFLHLLSLRFLRFGNFLWRLA